MKIYRQACLVWFITLLIAAAVPAQSIDYTGKTADTAMISGDFDGDNYCELIVDFGSLGVWMYYFDDAESVL